MARMFRDEVRRFPLPWTVEGNSDAFWVVDAEGKRFGFTYYRRDGRGPIGSGYGLELNKREALRIVRNIAKLPLLLRHAEREP